MTRLTSFLPRRILFLSPAAPAMLSRRERALLGFVVALTVAFGGVVVMRAAFLKRPMTDLQVFLRAAWAAKSGADIYAITDDNGWHYHYPPLLAILLTPLADPPAGADRAGVVPFAVSALLWYVFGLACLAAGVHALASALEEATPLDRRRWWRLRVAPVLACLPSVGGTLSRGQVGLLLLALLCFVAAAVTRRRPYRAGAWLAAAVCLKVIPAYLVVYPLWRRDLRLLAGGAAGLFVGLALIPAAYFGPRATLACYREWYEVLVRPALGHGEDRSRADELLNVTATDSQSLLAMIHNNRYPDRRTRPAEAEPLTRLAHWSLGGVLTLLTLTAAGRAAGGSRLRPLLLLTALVPLMLLLSPVCHLHYFCLVVPLLMALLARHWEAPAAGSGAGLRLLFAVNFVGQGLAHLPGMTRPRDAGVCGVTTLGLWLVAVLVLATLRRSTSRVATLAAP